MSRIHEGAERPTFDFSNYSHRDALARDRVRHRFNRVLAQLSDPEHSDEEYTRLEGELDALRLEHDALLVKVIVAVPRAWLVSSAPESVDWTAPASLEYLRQDKMPALLEAMAAALDPESASGE